MSRKEELLLKRLMHFNHNALYPGKGKQQATLIREICDAMGWDEDQFLPSFMVKNKSAWGLKER